ncbi:MAG: hypothetical protein PHE09_14260 [Oscillospiraceae bacterium]|nr:hypothetical protein [Oscillospiraceae bacterium]
MKVTVNFEAGDIVTIKDPYTSNQVGGTVQIEGIVKARITDSWYDYEIGQRYKGLLFQEEDIELSKKVGKSEYGPEHYKQYGDRLYQETVQMFKDYDPRKVYFGQFDIVCQREEEIMNKEDHPSRSMSEIGIAHVRDYFEDKLGGDLDLFTYALPDEGPGLAYIYEGDHDVKYKALMYQDRIRKTDDTNDKILEGLAEGKAFSGDENDPLKALECIMTHFNLLIPESIMDEKVYIVPDFKTSISILKSSGKEYIFSVLKENCKKSYEPEEVQNILIFKGIAFDEFTEDEYGTYGEICDECLGRHPDLKTDVESTKTAICCCSVLGCENTVEGSDEGHYYIDFDNKDPGEVLRDAV